jgi:inosine/guanosine/xanthosine phosphorylase family protein
MTLGVPGPPDRIADAAAAVVRERWTGTPVAGVVLGSGLGEAFGDALKVAAEVPYGELPGFPQAAVPGHAGTLLLGTLAGTPVAAFSGRFHLYEGHPPDVPALLPRVAHALGAGTMVLTAAVGGLVAGIPTGTVVLVRDHLNMMGSVPLAGWRYPDGTPAFISAEDIYDPTLRAWAAEGAAALDIRMAEGVYAATRGPAFETPAEVQMLAGLGATVVGMSMVPEALAARALGLRVLGVCSLTNAFGDHVTHEEVLRVSATTAAAIGRLLVDLFPRLPGQGA